MSELKVTVERVNEVHTHPNADRLDLVVVRGWQIIVGRDQYKVGDACVYVPIDSVLPVDLAHEWGVAQYMKGNMRVRTIKLRGQVSQGLVVPVDKLPPGVFPVGSDVTDVLGIKKWEPTTKMPRNMAAGSGYNTRRTTPYFPRYTDIDHLSNTYKPFSDDEWVQVHEKRHGTNFRMGWVPIYEPTLRDRLSMWWNRFKWWMGREFDPYKSIMVKLHVGSHNVIREKHDDDLYWRVARLVINRHGPLLPYFVYFFEVSGPEIQKGFDYGRIGNDVVVELIDIYSTKSNRYLSANEIERHCHIFNFQRVPYICGGKWSLLKEVYKDYATGTAEGATHIKEGVVLRSDTPEGRKIYKYISPDYLIAQGKKAPEDATEWH